MRTATLTHEAPPDDGTFLQRLRAADPEACETVARLYWESVYRQHYLLCGDRDAAADLTQETFVEAWKGVRGFRGASNIRTWLHTIAVRVHHRYRTHWAKRAPDQAFAAEIETLSDPALSPQASAEQAITGERVRAALQKLPDAQRESLVLFYGRRCATRKSPPRSACRLAP